MSTEEAYTNYEEPIELMKALTAKNTPFKIKFMKQSGEVRIITHCLLRKQAPTDKDSKAKYKLQYIDKQADSLGSCYIPLLMELNNKPIKLS